MPYCSVKYCNKNSTTSSLAKDGITFHQFPRDSETRKFWVKACNKPSWTPKETSTICSRHFMPNQFRNLPNSGNRRKLVDFARPTLFITHVNCNPNAVLELNLQEQPSTTKKRKRNNENSASDEDDCYIEDEYDVWVKECALELRQMEPEQQIFAKRAITFILMEGRLGLLHKNSVQINNKIPEERTTQKNADDSSLDEFLLIRTKDAVSSSVVAVPKFTGTSGSSQLPVDPAISSVAASHKYAGRPSSIKAKSSHKTTICSPVTASGKNTTSDSSSSLESSFKVASHRTAVPVGSFSSLAKTNPCDNLSSNSVVACQEISAPDNLSSPSPSPDEIEASIGSLDPYGYVCTSSDDPLFMKTEPCNDAGPISSSVCHESAAPIERSSSVVKSEPNSPPSSPEFTVMVKNETE